MKVKLDENIPAAVAQLLRARDFDVDTVLEESLGGHADPAVLDAAATDGRLSITLDRGFGDVRAYPTREPSRHHRVAPRGPAR